MITIIIYIYSVYYYFIFTFFIFFFVFFLFSFGLLVYTVVVIIFVLCYTQSSATSNERWARNTVIPDVVCTLIQVHGAGEEKELPYTQKKARELSDRCQRILDTPYTTVKTRDK